MFVMFAFSCHVTLVSLSLQPSTTIAAISVRRKMLFPWCSTSEVVEGKLYERDLNNIN